MTFGSNTLLIFVGLTQVCDSDTMLDPASSVEMVKVLEEDPMVGGVGGDVQVITKLRFSPYFLLKMRHFYDYDYLK